ncbi:MAG: LamG domain-containing protein [Sedimentisphaerales bacterium]|nr:LamG domain-containing protein [Sedimentisphaerales bacterium]
MCRKLICLVFSFLVLGVAVNAHADLVGYWTLDEGSGSTATDVSGNGNDGILVDNNVWDIAWISGICGGAVEFYGVGTSGGNGDYFDCGSDASLNMTGPVSIALWIRPDADDPEGKLTTTAPLSKTDGSDWSFQVRYGWGQGAPEPYMSFTFNSSPRAWAHVNQNLERFEWCHIACSHDGVTLKCYLNGEQTNETPMGQFAGVGTPVLIGTDGWGCDWIGAIDDVRMYDHALSEAEILGTMEGGMSPEAWGPEPKDGALHPDTWVTLRWKAGPFAASHDVYLGDDMDAVSNDDVSGATFCGNQALTYIVAGFPGFPFPDGLVPGTTYYWRIDEVNEANPDSPWKGPVWSFSIPPKTAYFPNPSDGAESIGPDSVILTWTPGYGAKLHTVYFGEDYDQVDTATVGKPSGTATYSTGALEREKVYYWRVDEFDGLGTYKGDVWSFTTPGAVGNPQPAYDAADVQLNTVLSWTPSDSAASHQLYFGTDKEAVRTAGAGSPENKGSKALGAESYDPGLLEANTTYYWRVDEVKAQGNTLKGPIWIFTTGSYLLVEDFESYTDNDADGEAIWQTWIDGYGIADNGAQVGYLMPPYAEQSIVHGGDQSMPLLFTNEGGVTNSEASMTLTAPRDWTQASVAELSIWFRGSSSNAAEPLYAAIANSAGAPAIVAHDNPEVVATSGWKQWQIPLQAFADQGINLGNVNTIAIGLGTKSGIAGPGGTGTLYVDDIRLYQP